MADQSVNGCEGTHPTFWGKGELTEGLAIQCRDEMEKKTKEPHTVGFFKGIDYPRPYYFVYPLPGCHNGATYDDKISLDNSNENRARECADVLRRLTGNPHITQPIERFFWADAFEVIEFPELP